MKKLIVFCLGITTLCLSLLVINLFRTNEINRIQEIEMTDYSFKIYPKNSVKSVQEVLTYFENFSEQYHLSIVKTDDNSDRILKSIIINHDNFPNQQVSGQELSFSPTSTKKYTSEKEIPVFLNARKITIQSMREYFQNPVHSINGTYTIVSTKTINQDKLLADLSDFFSVDIATLTTPSTFKRTGIVNQNFIITIVILFLSIMILLMSSIYLPIVEMKKIGVKKLLGYSKNLIFWENLQLHVIAIIITSILINTYCFLFMNFTPKNFYLVMILIQILTLFFYVFVSLLTQLIVNRITIASMLKNFSGLDGLIYLNVALKIIVSFLLSYLILGIAFSTKDMQEQLNYQKNWEKIGKEYVTIENYIPSNQLWESINSGSDKAHNYFYSIFQTANQITPVDYVRSELLIPSERFASSKFQNLDSLNIMFVNQNYLDKVLPGIKYSINENQKLFFLPKKYENKREIMTDLSQEIYKSLLVYEEQQTIVPNTLITNIIFYEKELETFSFQDGLDQFIDPILVLVDDKNMLYEEKAYLSDTGLSNPMKIPNNKKEIQIISKKITLLDTQTKIKFSSLTAIRETTISSLEDGIKNITFLASLLASMSLVVSAFMISITYNVKREYFNITKFLGWKLHDRYFSVLLTLCIIYFCSFVIIGFIKFELFSIIYFLIYICLDLTMIFLLAYRMERKNLSQKMKEM